LEILEDNCTDNYPNTFAPRSPKVIHLIPGEHGEILGRLQVGWEKVTCWSTKTAISLKRVIGHGPSGPLCSASMEEMPHMYMLVEITVWWFGEE